MIHQEQKVIDSRYLKLTVSGLLSLGKEYNSSPLHSYCVAEHLIDKIKPCASKQKELQSILDQIVFSQPEGKKDVSSLIKFIDDNLIPWWMHR